MTKLFGNQTELPKEAEDQHKKKMDGKKKKKQAGPEKTTN